MGWEQQSDAAQRARRKRHSFLQQRQHTNTGWVAGAGVEVGFREQLDGETGVRLRGAERFVLLLYRATFIVPALQNDVFSTSNRNVQTVTVGITNYLPLSLTQSPSGDGFANRGLLAHRSS